VPALLASAWLPRGKPFHGVLDHTCFARTALQLFAPDKVDQLSARVSRSPSLVGLLTEEAPRTDAVRVDGVPIVAQAIAPVMMGDDAPPGFHSMELTESQKEVEALRRNATAAGVPPAQH
jgi:phospholipase C